MSTQGDGFVLFWTYPVPMTDVHNKNHDGASTVAEAVAHFTDLGVMPAPGQIVADIGCGTGLAGFAAIRHVADASCISIDHPETLNAAKGLAAQIGVENRVTFRPADSVALQLENDSAHVVYLNPNYLAQSGKDDVTADRVVEFLRALRHIVLPGGAVYVRNVGDWKLSGESLVGLAESAGFDDVVWVNGGGVILRRPPLADEDAA